MKNRVLIMLAALVLMCPLFSACSGSAASSASRTEIIQIYRLVTEDYRTGGELIRPESILLEEGADPLHAMLIRLTGPSVSDGLKNPLPTGTEILSYSLEDGEIILDLSPSYLELAGMDKTIADYCLTLTLSALSEVEAVSIYVEGQAFSQGLTSDDAVLYDTETNPFEKQLRLYFADSGGRYLSQEYHSITVSEDTAVERVVMEELLRGPYDENLVSAIPDGTALISVSTEEGLCTVDLSAEFYYSRPVTAIAERLAVYSIVNSLTSLSNVDRVSILIGGVAYARYRYLSLAQPLERAERAIGPASSAKGEADVDLVFASEDGGFFSIPTVVERDEVLTLEQSALENLIMLDPEPGFADLFGDEDVVISAETRNGVCAVIMNRDFFDSRADAGEAAERSVWAIVATLTQLDGVDSVRLVSEDGLIDSLGTIDLSAELTVPSSIVIIH